jgi:putative hydrolase of the HAD superfamily
MDMSRIRGVVFDAVGTLIHPYPSAPLVYRKIGARFGSRLSREEIGRRFSIAYQEEEARDSCDGFRTSEAREIQRWQNIVAQVLDDVSDSSACFNQLFEYFSRPGAWRCVRQAAQVLEALAQQSMIVGVASNYDGRLRQVVAGLSALRLVEHLVISSEVGWRKPAPEFFGALVRTLGVPADQIMYVGDDLVNDYEGARSAGLQTILFDPHDRAAPSVVRVTRLTEVGG